MEDRTRACVLGIWHLGAIYSACLADLGYSVAGWDEDRKKVAELNKGIPPIFEPGLDNLLHTGLFSKTLTYTTDLKRALHGAAYAVLTIDTPVDAEDKVNLSSIFSTTLRMAEYLEPGSTIIISSQVPLGSCEQIKRVVRQQNPSLDFNLAYCPENLRLGQAIERFMKPEMIIIGADDPDALQSVETFWAPVQAPKVKMDLKSAEMTKHAINSFLGMCISFSNELANLGDTLGVDAQKVVSALRLEGRIGKNAPLSPGLGFSGGTLARDLKVLQDLGDQFGCETYLVDAVLRVNEQQNRVVVNKLEKVYGKVDGLNIGILGLTYKPGTSTLRRSAAIDIIQELVSRGATVKAHDPKVSEEELQGHSEFRFCSDPEGTAQDSDALIIMTDWPQFKALNFQEVKSRMRRAVLIDARNMLDGAELAKIGFTYLGIGRGK